MVSIWNQKFGRSELLELFELWGWYGSPGLKTAQRVTCRWAVASEMVGGPEEMSGGDVLVFQEMTDAVAHTLTISPLTDTAGAGLSGVTPASTYWKN